MLNFIKQAFAVVLISGILLVFSTTVKSLFYLNAFLTAGLNKFSHVLTVIKKKLSYFQ